MASTVINATVLSIIVVSASLFMPVRANNFLRRNPGSASVAVSEETVRTSLLEEIEGALGTGTAARRVSRLEASLSPMFKALPKNEHGNLGHTTVRYALHRLFVQRHGWYVNGFEPDGNAQNASSDTGMLTGAVPSYLQGLFESRLGNQGFSLHESAVFAATIEHLIHNETLQRLEWAYEAKGFQQSDHLTEGQIDTVINAYMKIYILGRDVASLVEDKDIPNVYPGWSENQEFVRNTRKTVLYAEGDHKHALDSQTYDIGAVLRVAEEIGEQYGLFQDTECRQLKKDLLHHGDPDTGRVQIANFYEAALDHGMWQFQESADYLQRVGALDESDPKNPHVIVPNYVGSATNCVASSSFYSVCCTNECEALLGHLEREVAAPEGEPEHLAQLVASIPTSTVQAPRELPASLVARLHEVAAGHGGTVPLHGRLFAQWMHHAFPRECPYPHLSGTTRPQSPDEWMEETGAETAEISEAEMRRIVEDTRANVQATTTRSTKQEGKHLPWSTEEELLVSRSVTRKAQGNLLVSVTRSAMLLVVLASGALALVHTLQLALGTREKQFRPAPAKTLEKYLV